nr:protein trichome birefringence-like 6 [Tanacetum cinerariifolium]
MNLDDTHNGLSVNRTKDFDGYEKKSNFNDTHEGFNVNSTKEFDGYEKKSNFNDTHEGFGVNSTKDFDGSEKRSNLGVNGTKILDFGGDFVQNVGVNGTQFVDYVQKVGGVKGTKNLDFRGLISEGVDPVEGESVCDVTNGKWIYDEGSKLYTSGTCPFIDEGFNCEGNGRLDKDYMNWRWKLHDCDIPRIGTFVPMDNAIRRLSPPHSPYKGA